MRVYPITYFEESHLWYSYDVMVNVTSNEWTLPKIVEKRNVYWDYRTSSSLNGVAMEIGSIYNWKGDYLKCQGCQGRFSSQLRLTCLLLATNFVQ
jgi:hypothetical protein